MNNKKDSSKYSTAVLSSSAALIWREIDLAHSSSNSSTFSSLSLSHRSVLLPYKIYSR